MSRYSAQKTVYMRYYMRLKTRADRLGITVRELREREGIVSVVPPGPLPPPSSRMRKPVVSERWSWLGGCYWRAPR